MDTFFEYDPNTGQITGVMNCAPSLVEGKPYIEKAPSKGVPENYQDFFYDKERGVISPFNRRVTPDEVNAERDRRILLGFSYMDHWIDYDTASQSRIERAALRAERAIRKGELEDEIFLEWVTSDNTRLLLTYEQVAELGDAAADHESKLIIKARSLKDLGVGSDFKDDKYWND